MSQMLWERDADTHSTVPQRKDGTLKGRIKTGWPTAGAHPTTPPPETVPFLLFLVFELEAADQNRQGHHRQQTGGKHGAVHDQHQRRRHMGQVPFDHLMQAQPGSGVLYPLMKRGVFEQEIKHRHQRQGVPHAVLEPHKRLITDNADAGKKHQTRNQQPRQIQITADEIKYREILIKKTEFLFDPCQAFAQPSLQVVNQWIVQNDFL